MTGDSATHCPDDDTLVRFTEGLLPKPVAGDVEVHLADCADCRELVGAAAGDVSESLGEIAVAEDPSPAVGDLVGRYRLTDVIGEGAMGIVYSAQDPELDREVAVKLVKVASQASPSRRRRMIREAQAMAKLSHPNVVPVFDVGECPAGVFVVMELVRGVDLRDWWEGRSWSEIVARFVECGRGLAAAHAAGLIHRDFKPSNVLVGADGRARVTDFGLAGTLDADTTEASLDSDPAALKDAIRLTRTGDVMGTPAYMSPEQFTGRKVTSATDQFSFCVTLAEAIGRRRPTIGRTFRDLASSVVDAGERVELGASGAPETLVPLIRQGLVVDPAARFDSMSELVDGLTRILGRASKRRGPLPWIALAAVGIVGVVVATEPESDPCAAVSPSPSAAYDDDRRTALRAAFASTDAPFADDVWRSVDQRLGRYAGELETAAVQACQAAQSGELNDASVDRWRSCLTRAETAFADRLERFARADRAIVEHAVDQLATLPLLSRCAEMETLADGVAPPEDPKDAARVALLRARLDSLQAEAQTGQWQQARDGMESIVEQARELGYAPLLATSLLALGIAEAELGDVASAKAKWTESASVAEGAGDDRTAAWAAIRMVQVLALESVDEKAALDWARHGQAWLERSDDPLIRAQLDNATGMVHSRFDRFEQAAEYYARAYEAKRTLLGEDEPEVARDLANLGIAFAGQGRLEEASEHLIRATAQLENILGEHHPDVGRAHGNLGGIHSERGDHEAAAVAFARALATMEGNFGPDHPLVGYYHDSLGAELVAAGQIADGREHHRRALEILRNTQGDTHPEVAWAWGNLGLAALELKDHEEALRCFDRLLSIVADLYGDEHEAIGATYANKALVFAAMGRAEDALEQAELAVKRQRELLGMEHPATAEALAARGRANAAAQRHEPALEDYRVALRILESAGPKDHPDVGSMLVSIAEALLRLERADEALPLIDRALVTLATQPTELARAKFVAARVYWDQGRQDRARELGREAHTSYEARGQPFADERAQVAAWLARR